MAPKRQPPPLQNKDFFAASEMENFLEQPWDSKHFESSKIQDVYWKIFLQRTPIWEKEFPSHEPTNFYHHLIHTYQGSKLVKQESLLIRRLSVNSTRMQLFMTLCVAQLDASAWK